MIRSFAAASMTAAALLLPVGAAVVVTAPVALAAPAAPAPAELQGKLQAALNGSAAELESGDPSKLATVGQVINRLPGYTWSVIGPVTVDGDTLNATLNSCLGTCYPIAVTWKNVDGTWKFSRESEELLASYATMA
ncbi:hypothetical protein ACFVMC_05635 [Nocardia sp. NPDC127579]|uniref:hypothetical protein n=1 Tax=Nocardia sp. NPDC127579 TaxID=3345402 RepID=UPI0036299BC9